MSQEMVWSLVAVGVLCVGYVAIEFVSGWRDHQRERQEADAYEANAAAAHARKRKEMQARADFHAGPGY